MNKSSASRGILSTVATVLLGLEATLMAVFAVGYVVYALVDDSFTRLGLGLAVVFALFAAGLVATTLGFARGKRFAFSAAVTWQLMQASVAVWLMSSQPAAAVALLAAAIVVGFAAMRAASRWAAGDPLGQD